MGETLTTSQLIEILEIGQEAVCVEYPGNICIGWKVKREEIGLTGIDRNGEKDIVSLNKAVLQAKWRIVG